MVFGGDDEITHAGLARGARPLARVVEIGVEHFKVDPVFFFRGPLVILHPLVPRGG